MAKIVMQDTNPANICRKNVNFAKRLSHLEKMDDSGKITSYHINENLWADAEFYFYGMLVNAGGKDKTNIHIQTKDNGLITIATEKEFLQDREDNVLYKNFMVRANGRQNITTGAIDMASLHLLELTPYDPTYNEQYLARLIKRATPRWTDVGDADQWLSEIRGTNG